MLCQSVYMFRRTSGVHPWPKSRHDVDDKLFEIQISLLGGHQLLVDVSHCNQVSPQKLNLLQQCTSLCYLDLSYTKLTSIRSIVENCTNLKALMLAGLSGLTVDAYTALGRATTLEMLSLRNSKNVSDRAVAPIRDMLMLRSLDLGGADVTVAGVGHAVRGLSRLEELALDATLNLSLVAVAAAAAAAPGAGTGAGTGAGADKSKALAVGSSAAKGSIKGAAPAPVALPATAGVADAPAAVEVLLDVLRTLPSLRTLNLCESALDWPALQAANVPARLPHSTLHLECRSRRLQFCEAIMDNDTLTMRRLAGDGVDINMVLGPWFAPTLFSYWHKRCNAIANTKRVKTPCFLCEHPTEKHRPTPLALAVMWNAQGCVADLLFMGANAFMQVWFGEVLEAGGRMVVDEEAQEERAKQHVPAFLYLQQLPQAMYVKKENRPCLPCPALPCRAVLCCAYLSL
jgi:hypothetical protein